VSEDDKYRVEARLAGASKGVSPTTEQIQTLLERQQAHEKLTRPPPQKAFARVMREQGDKNQRGQSGEQTQDDDSQQQQPERGLASTTPSEPSAVSSVAPKDTFVRHRALPAGFQRSGRPRPVAAKQPDVVQAPPPTGPPPRSAPGLAAGEAAKSKKIIIRG
jgi:hypothetical protein